MKSFKSIITILGLIAVAVIWRIINHQYEFAPNLELVTLVSIIAALAYGWRVALLVSIGSMAVSDAIIGNTSILVYTWGAFGLIGLGAVILRKLNNKPKTQVLASAGFVIASSTLFFVITNFGVWLEGWYPMTWAGLATCYQLAIPFYRTMLIGNLIMVPVAVAAWQYLRVRAAARLSVVDSLVSDKPIVKVVL